MVLVDYCKGLHKEGGFWRGYFGRKMLWGFIRGLLVFIRVLGWLFRRINFNKDLLLN